jgi:hypothetical protein
MSIKNAEEAGATYFAPHNKDTYYMQLPLANYEAKAAKSEAMLADAADIDGSSGKLGITVSPAAKLYTWQ